MYFHDHRSMLCRSGESVCLRIALHAACFAQARSSLQQELPEVSADFAEVEQEVQEESLNQSLQRTVEHQRVEAPNSLGSLYGSKVADPELMISSSCTAVKGYHADNSLSTGPRCRRELSWEL